jgi:hypothetical protein
VITWAVGVALLSVLNLGGWVAVQRLKVLGTRPVGAEITATAEKLARRLKLARPVRVLQSLLAETPVVIGWLRPVVLLPVSVITGLLPAQLEAVLAHELAHIRRHDYLVNLFQVAVETLLFYHPAAWWMSRRIRLEREQCCDDVAVTISGDRYVYVESLAALEEVRTSGVLAVSASGSGRSQLLIRIQRLLGFRDDSPRRTARAIVAGAMLLLTVATFAAIYEHTSSSTQTGTVEPLSQISVKFAGLAPKDVRTLRFQAREFEWAELKDVALQPGGDSKAGDHEPSAAVAAAAPHKLLLVTDGNYFLERAIKSMGGPTSDLTSLTPAEYEAREAAPWDLVVFDRYQPKKALIRGAVLYFGAVPPQSNLAETDDQGRPVMVKDARAIAQSPVDPIVKDLTPNNVFVAEAIKLHETPGWATLAGSQHGPLIVCHRADGLREIVVAFDVQQSNWPLRTSFPTFIDDSFRWLLDHDGEMQKRYFTSLSPRQLTGTIIGVEGRTLTIRQNAAEGAISDQDRAPLKTVLADDNTAVTIDGRPAVIADLKAGMEVVAEKSLSAPGHPRLTITASSKAGAAKGGVEPPATQPASKPATQARFVPRLEIRAVAEPKDKSDADDMVGPDAEEHVRVLKPIELDERDVKHASETKAKGEGSIASIYFNEEGARKLAKLTAANSLFLGLSATTQPAGPGDSTPHQPTTRQGAPRAPATQPGAGFIPHLEFRLVA